MDGLIGKPLGPYRILARIGEGGMGVVYKGFQESLNRYVAVKVLRPELAHDEQFIARFRQEALAVAKLAHPNILHILDAGAAHGVYYLATDYVEGGSLKDLIRKGPVKPERAVAIAAQVAEALAYAHQRGLVHRDVKPANILLTRDGRPLLTDFGIARAIDASARLTRTGVHVGTPEYMAPEQAEGQAADGRTDIYALGIVLYEMLAGRVPFHADTPLATLYKQVNEPLPPLRQFAATVPAWLESVVAKASAKRPSDRFQQASDLASVLRQRSARTRPSAGPLPLQQPARPARSRRAGDLVPLLVGSMALLLLLIVTGGVFLALRGGGDGAGTDAAANVVTQIVTPEGIATEAITTEKVVTVIVTRAPGMVPTAPPTLLEADTPAPLPTDTLLVPTRKPLPPTETPRPAPAPTQKPKPTEAPGATCPSWYSRPQPGKGILLIENHIGDELQVEQIVGGREQWLLPAKQGETPGRLLLQLTPGDHEFVLYVAARGRGHIRLRMEEGQQFVSPVWFNYRYDEYVYPLETPPGCK